MSSIIAPRTRHEHVDRIMNRKVDFHAPAVFVCRLIVPSNTDLGHEMLASEPEGRLTCKAGSANSDHLSHLNVLSRTSRWHREHVLWIRSFSPTVVRTVAQLRTGAYHADGSASREAAVLVVVAMPV